MIVDCHIHTWRYPEHFNKEMLLRNLPPHRRGWSEERLKATWDTPIEAYLQEMEGVVDRAILLGLKSRDTLGIDVANEYLAEVARKYPEKLAWCCCVDPTEEGALEEVERCVKKLGAVGIGELNPSLAAYHINDRRCYPIYERAQEWGLPIFLHATPSPPRLSRMIYGNLRLVDEVALDFPDLKIVLCHIGSYDYEDGVFLIRKHENLFGDVSWLGHISGLDRHALPRGLPVVDFGYYYHWLRPLLYYFSHAFGDPDKLLFGSDWHVGTPRRSLDILRDANRMLREMRLPEIPEESLYKILHENWKKVFNLWGAS